MADLSPTRWEEAAPETASVKVPFRSSVPWSKFVVAPTSHGKSSSNLAGADWRATAWEEIATTMLSTNPSRAGSAQSNQSVTEGADFIFGDVIDVDQYWTAMSLTHSSEESASASAPSAQGDNSPDVPHPASFLAAEKFIQSALSQNTEHATLDEWSDAVMAPLGLDYEFWAIPGLSCWRSALVLALSLIKPCQLVTYPRRAGITVAAMQVVLHRLGSRFPLYTMDLDPEPKFTLLFGEPRADFFAMCYIPGSILGGDAHWTFTRYNPNPLPCPPVNIVEEPLVEYGPAGPDLSVPPTPPPFRPRPSDQVVVYTSLPFPIVDTNVYWRAKVDVVDLQYLSEAMNLHPENVCTCDWSIQCKHELRFLSTHDRAIRVSMDDDFVVGTWHASIDNVSPPFRRLRMGTSMKVFWPDGVARRIPMYTPAILYPRGLLSTPLTDKGTERTAFEKLFGRSEGLVPFQELRILKLGPWDLKAIYHETATSLRHRAKSLLYHALGAPMSDYFKPLDYRYPFADRPQEVVRVERRYPPLERVSVASYDLPLPRATELMTRLAIASPVTLSAPVVRDMLRLACLKENWAAEFDADVVQAWIAQLTSLSTTPGFALPGFTSRQCWSCGKETKTKWHHCKACKCRNRALLNEPIVPAYVQHVGFLPLFSKRYRLPPFGLKPDVKVQRGKTKKMSGSELIAYVTTSPEINDPTVGQRGLLCGCMFLGMQPSCFPRGEDHTLGTFCIRLGVERLHEAQPGPVDALFQLAVLMGIDQLEAESDEVFMAHFSGPKKRKMLEARRAYNHGTEPGLIFPKGQPPRMTFKGFIKGEKSHSANYDDGPIMKEYEKPRLICCPDPIVLYMLGPYTHSQTKWLAHHFDCESPLYYAGCSKPGDLNRWINRSLEKIPDAVSFAADITAIDSNYSQLLFGFIAKVRALQYPDLPAEIRRLFDAEEHLTINFGGYKAEVNYVNASGVSDTSYKNSLVSLFAQLYSFCYAMNSTFATDGTMEKLVQQVLTSVDFAISGDDSLTRTPRFLGPHDTMSRYFHAKYVYAWSQLGFTVKLQVYPETEWRLATFLGNRPVWAGTEYRWAPEPARRLRSLYWQIDTTMHPVAWARGVSRQIVSAAGHAPVLADIARWMLRITEGGPTAVVEANPYNPMSFNVGGDAVTERAITEFLADYSVEPEEYNDFLMMLSSVADPLVDISLSIIHKIFMHE